MHSIVRQVVSSPVAGLRYQALRDLLQLDAYTRRMHALAWIVQTSPEAQALLHGWEADPPHQRGPHALWRLVALADLGCQPGEAADPGPLLDAALAWLTDAAYEATLPTIDDWTRLPATREAHAILAALRLGVPDERLGALADRLCRTQGPDGGWLDDASPNATRSTLAQTVAPLEALAFWNAMTGDAPARRAAHRAADLLLRQKLQEPDAAYAPLTWPSHAGYSPLRALLVMRQIGWLEHPHCAPALDWLADQRLPDGGWPAQAAAPAPDAPPAAYQHAIWGAPAADHANPWVTLQALDLLSSAERLPEGTLAPDETALTVAWAEADAKPLDDLALPPVTLPDDAAPADITRTLVARRGDRLAGLLELQDYRHVSLWCVQPWEYGRGVGRALMDRAIAEVRLHEPDQRDLTANATQAVRGAYEALGFCASAEPGTADYQRMALRLEA